MVLFLQGIHNGYLDGFVQERRYSSALAMALRLFCTNPSVSSAQVVFFKYIPLFGVDVITHPFPNLDVGLANLCW